MVFELCLSSHQCSALQPKMVGLILIKVKMVYYSHISRCNIAYLQNLISRCTCHKTKTNNFEFSKLAQKILLIHYKFNSSYLFYLIFRWNKNFSKSYQQHVSCVRTFASLQILLTAISFFQKP